MKILLSARLMGLSALICAMVFLLFPELDLWASGWWYRADGGFMLRSNAFFAAVHDYIGLLSWLTAGAAALVWLMPARGDNGNRPRRRRAAAFVVLTMLLGPGLLVNVVLKDHWGRARPGHVENFGGKAHFTPAWVISDQCQKNCSFVCGDASVGFGLIALAFVARRPRPWLALGLALGVALGLMRMGQGGHFLSDVVFSFYAVWFVAWLLHRLMLAPRRPSAASP